MKRFLLTACLATMLGLLTATSVFAAGRLNFMLINFTGVDIVDVRICPTYYPNFISENLLNTKLEPNTRIYIGPNYYGEEKYWTIQLTWANGYSQTFPYSRLTRYNTYLTYATPYGVRMRQSYERAFARYDFGGAYSSGVGSMPGSYVAVSAPEKVNVASPRANNMAAAQASNLQPALLPVTANTRRATRDLVFDDDEGQAAPTVAGSTADKVQGEVIAMKATVELTRNGQTSTVLPTESFRSGDKVRLIFSTNRDGHIYWLARGTSGEYQVLYPNKKAGMDNSVVRNKEYTVPVKGAWRFDEKKGTETLVCVLSPNAVADLDKAAQLAGAGQRQAASDIVANIVNGHENKRTTRDLVFEEEDDLDVNTKSQKTADNEPFVATYELMHE